MINFDQEFLAAFQEVAGYTIPNMAMEELINYYPGVYGGLTPKDWKKPENLHRACRDYIKIVRNYLISSRMPVTIENLTAVYDWGMANLRSSGIEKAPARVKRYIAQIKHKLQAQDELIEAEYTNKG